MPNLNPLGEACIHRKEEAAKIIPLKEKKSEYRFEPKRPKQVTVYQVDPCMFQDEVMKCDFLLLNFSDNQAYFVELKNPDLDKAIDQLDKSLDLLAGKLKREMREVKIYCRAVVSQVRHPNIPSEKRKRLETRVKGLGGTFERQSQKFIERID